MSLVKEGRRQSLQAMLERLRRRLADEVATQVGEAGFGDLRPSHMAVFAFLPEGGARHTTLAQRARVTKQSMGELVQELERLGYVERRPDPGDARAKLVILTDRGRGAREVGLRAMDAIEARWTRALGGHDVPPLRTVLTTLLELPD